MAINEEYQDHDFEYDCEYDRYLDCQDDDNEPTNRPYRYLERRILPGLHPLIEEVRAANGKAKKGDSLKCPMCGRNFIKKSYQQKFCCNDCKVRYHNKRQVWV